MHDSYKRHALASPLSSHIASPCISGCFPSKHILISTWLPLPHPVTVDSISAGVPVFPVVLRVKLPEEEKHGKSRRSSTVVLVCFCPCLSCTFPAPCLHLLCTFAVPFLYLFYTLFLPRCSDAVHGGAAPARRSWGFSSVCHSGQGGCVTIAGGCVTIPALPRCRCTPRCALPGGPWVGPGRSLCCRGRPEARDRLSPASAGKRKRRAGMMCFIVVRIR